MIPGQGAALRGIGMMALAGLFNTVTGIMVRHLSDDFSVMEMVFFRNVIALVVLLPWLLHRRTGSMKLIQLPLYGLRTIFTYLGMLMTFYALANMPIAKVFALQFTIPLLTIMLAVFFLGQTAGLRSWIGCLVGFAGALVIIRPGFIELGLATTMVLGSVILYAGSNTMIKLLTRDQSPMVITIYSNLFMLPLALIPTLFVWVTPGWEDWPWIIGLGLTSGIGGLCFTAAVGAADARVVQPFQFLRMPIAALLGYMVFGEVADGWIWTGAVIIFAAATYVGRIETRRKAGET